MTTRATRDVIDLSTRPVLSVDIDGGSIDGVSIGATTPDVGFFTNLQTSNLTVTNTADFSGATVTGLQAFYADLAEYYEADEEYEPGTVVKLGGEKEITKTMIGGDIDVFGVVSTQPAMVMNQEGAEKEGIWLPVALVGRVPVKVTGAVKKGDRLIAGLNGTGMASHHVPGGLTFGRSLVDDEDTGPRMIEAAIVTVR